MQDAILATTSQNSEERRCPEREQAQTHAEIASIYMMIAGAMNWFIVAGVGNIIPLYAHLKWQTLPGYIGILLAVSGILSAFGIPFWIQFGHNHGFGVAVTYTYLPTIFCSAWMGVTDSFLIFSLCFAFNSLFNLSDEVTGTFIADVMPRSYSEEWVSANLGIVQILLILGMIFMSVLFEYVSYDSIFYASAVFSLVTFIFCYFTVVGIQKRLHNEMIEAYKADAKRQGFDETSPDYATGIVNERDEFPIVLHEYNAYIEAFDFWSLSRSELLLFTFLTLLYAVFGGCMTILLAWWPLFCFKKWNVGVIEANSQLILFVVTSTITSVVAPMGVEWMARQVYGEESSYTPISSSTDGTETEEEVRGEPEQPEVSQTRRDKMTIIHFVVVVLICTPLWYLMIVADLSFTTNWAVIFGLGAAFGWGVSCLILLVLRFQRAGDSSQIFGIQGLMWSIVLAMLHLCVGAIWHRYGYKAIVIIPLIGCGFSLLASAYAYGVYSYMDDAEKMEN